MYGQKGSSFTLVKCSFTDSTVITRSITILEKRYLFSHVPQPSDFSMPGTWSGNGSFSTCSSRNFVLNLFRAAWPQIWDYKTKQQSSTCKGVTPGQVLRISSACNLFVPLLPHHWGQVTQTDTEKPLGSWASIAVGNLCVSCHLKTRNNSISQKSDDSLYIKYW